MKRCIDCKFHDYHYGYCSRKQTHVLVPDPVRGGFKKKDTSPMSAYGIRAEDERRARRPWKCGMKARYFRPSSPINLGLIR